MDAHRLKAQDVATILECTPATVRIWRCRSDGRVIPATSLRLLELELGGRNAA